MDMTEKLNGIIAVMNTPFTADDRIDQDSIRRYVNYALAGGVVGFLVPALAAEVYKLSLSERNEIVATVLKAVNGRVPVIGGATAATQSERIRITRSLIDLGCDGVLVALDYEKGTFEKNIYEIADLQPGFLMIQDWDFHGFGIPVDVIARLFEEIDVFKCLKVEVVPAGMKYTSVLQATNGRLHVSGGWAGMQMIEALDRGVNAFMPSIMLGVYNRIYRLHQKGMRDEAKQLFQDFLPILAFSHQHLDISIHFNKRLMHRMGIFTTIDAREPILPFDKYHERISDEMIEKAIRLDKMVARENLPNETPLN